MRAWILLYVYTPMYIYMSTAVKINPKSEITFFELISSSYTAEKELYSKSKIVFL